MTFLWTLPWPVVALIFVAGTAVCYLGWKSASGSSKHPAVTWGRRAGMVALASTMLATPGTVAYTDNSGTNATIYFVVDTTGSMAAQDYNGKEQRLEGVKADVLEIAHKLPGARYSVLEFSSKTFQTMPLTTDIRALVTWSELLDREISNYSVGSSINRPVKELTRLLEKAAEARPQDVRILVYLGDGEGTDSGNDSKAGTKPDFEGLKEYVDAGVVFGYGTEEGGTMMRNLAYVEDKEDDLIMDPETNQPALSKINEDNLKEIASQLGIDYVHRTKPGGAADGLESIDVESIALEHEKGRRIYNPLLWPFGIGIALLFGWELVSLVPRVRSVASTVMPKDKVKRGGRK